MDDDGAGVEPQSAALEAREASSGSGGRTTKSQRTSTSMSNNSAHSSGSATSEVAGVLRSSCAWQEVVDVNGGCSLEPRSCRECLNGATTSGKVLSILLQVATFAVNNGDLTGSCVAVYQECVLTPTGLCKAASAYVAAQDYRRNVSAESDANYFLAATVSYCALNDDVCTACVRAKADVTRLSDYCVGTDGCVCVSICENAQWEMLAQAQLPSAMASEGESSDCASTGATEPRGSAPLTPPQAFKKHELATEDRCTWYTNQTRCGLPRTCYDCLNIPLASGEVGCHTVRRAILLSSLSHSLSLSCCYALNCRNAPSLRLDTVRVSRSTTRSRTFASALQPLRPTTSRPRTRVTAKQATTSVRTVA